jgi:hypothetical protein
MDEIVKLPPVARLEYEHGDHRIVLEVPPEQAIMLVTPWLDLAKDIGLVR